MKSRLPIAMKSVGRLQNLTGEYSRFNGKLVLIQDVSVIPETGYFKYIFSDTDGKYIQVKEDGYLARAQRWNLELLADFDNDRN